MRLATFNVENLFERPLAMNQPTWDEGRKILDDFNRLNKLIAAETYTAHTKQQIVEIYRRQHKFINLVEIRHKLLKSANGSFQVVAAGRRGWLGWFELKEAPVEEPAIENTARVIREVNPDVLCVIEAEDRPSLNRFNKTMIPDVGGTPLEHVMLVEGNDDRGIDVAILARNPAQIIDIVSHVDDKDENGNLIFSRDCAEYTVVTPSGEKLLVLVNHFKSRDGKATSDEKRRRQADRVREIYNARRTSTDYHPLVAVAGDLNDNPEHGPLNNLLGDSSDLMDVMSHQNFHGDGRPGTYGNGTKNDKIDYILMSPELADKVQDGGIERRGVWGGKNGDLFPHFPELTEPVEAASDHAALWVDLDL